MIGWNCCDCHFMNDSNYHPQTKLREGNVVTPAYDSVHRGSLSRGGSLSGRPPPHTVKIGRYASYWNAFCFFYIDE